MKTDEELVAAIYGAAMLPERWGSLLATVGERFGATSGFFFSTHSEKRPDAFMSLHNIDPQMLQAWHAYWHTQDIWAASAARAGVARAGSVVLADELMPRSAVLRTAFYQSHLKPYQLEGLLAAVLFDDQGDLPLTHICWYRENGCNAFQREDKQLLQRMLPHLQEAARMRWRLANLENEVADAAAMRRLCRTAMFKLDEHGGVLSCDAAAESVLAGRHGGLLRCRGRHIVGVGDRCSPAWPAALAQASQGTPMRLTAVNASGELIEANLLPRAVENWAEGRFLLLLDLPVQEASEALMKRVMPLFGLTPSEASIGAALVDGESVEEIASRRSLSSNTVRTHVKNLLSKTGVSRQIDLLRLLARFTRSG